MASSGKCSIFSYLWLIKQIVGRLPMTGPTGTFSSPLFWRHLQLLGMTAPAYDYHYQRKYMQYLLQLEVPRAPDLSCSQAATISQGPHSFIGHEHQSCSIVTKQIKTISSRKVTDTGRPVVSIAHKIQFVFKSLYYMNKARL